MPFSPLVEAIPALFRLFCPFLISPADRAFLYRNAPFLTGKNPRRGGAQCAISNGQCLCAVFFGESLAKAGEALQSGNEKSKGGN
jgi:hypothetical protein